MDFNIQEHARRRNIFVSLGLFNFINEILQVQIVSYCMTLTSDIRFCLQILYCSLSIALIVHKDLLARMILISKKMMLLKTK